MTPRKKPAPPPARFVARRVVETGMIVLVDTTDNGGVKEDPAGYMLAPGSDVAAVLEIANAAPDEFGRYRIATPLPPLGELEDYS
jgi:hypothetical protein